MAQTLADLRPRGAHVVPLVRLRLLERLESSANFPITLIIAPAGYGKSVLLRQFLESEQKTHVRFALRSEHSELLSFLRGFAEALGEHAPHAITSLAGAYERNQTSPRRSADLARWMRAHLDESFHGTIAIDDLHNGDGDPDIARFLTAFIELCKGSISWVLASRSTSGLPIASWLAYGDADLPIGEADLRFTMDEAAAAAADSGLPIGASEMRALLHITEGWPAALTFAMRTSTRSSDLRNISAVTREMTYRFLAEQVYNALTDEERELLDLAIALPAIDVTVLERAGFDQALQIVEGLRQRTAFISEESPGTYHCHDLFRDFLRHQSALSGKEAKERVSLRAARALESSGDIEHAIATYASAAAGPDTMRLLEAHGFDLLERAQSDVVTKALRALDESARRGDGCGLFLRGALEAMAGRPTRAEALLRRSLSDPGNTRELKAKIALRLASILANARKDVTSILSIIESDNEQNVAYRAEAASFIAAQKAVDGHHQAAAMALDRTFGMLVELNVDSARARTLHKIGIAYHHIGKLDLAIQALKASSEIASELHLFALVSRVNSVLSNLALQDDDVMRQLLYAEVAADAAAKAGDSFAVQTATLQLLSAQTRLRKAAACEALERSLKSANDVVSRHVAILRSVRLGWEGRFQEAHQLLSSAWLAMPFDFDRMTSGAAYSLFLALDGNTLESSKIVTAVAPMLTHRSDQGRYSTRASAMALVFCALAEVINGRTVHGNRLLASLNPESDLICKLMKSAGSELIRLSGSSGDGERAKRAIALLEEYQYGNVAGILDAACDQFLRRMHTEDNGRRLTLSEVHVLKSLEQGLSAKEIAQASNRSINTIRAHIANAVAKLGCHTQAQAVRSARNLMLI